MAILAGIPRNAVAQVVLALTPPGPGRPLLLTTTLEPGRSFPALSPTHPVLWPWEASLRGTCGVTLEGEVPGPWRLPSGWPEGGFAFPRGRLLSDLPRPPELESPLPLELVEGPGAFRIPLGPISSWVGESRFFLFEVTGEDIHHLGLQANMKMRGVEKRFENLPLKKALPLAELVSGTSSVAHSLAFVQAAEAVWGLEPPGGALAARVCLLELERIIVHLSDLGRACQATGLAVAEAAFRLLEEKGRRTAQSLTAHRFLRGAVSLGGIAGELPAAGLTALTQFLGEVDREVPRLSQLALSTYSHRDRLETAGRLTPLWAKALGARGPVARASDQDTDTRRDQPFALYGELPFSPALREEGDALARWRVRVSEIATASKLIAAAADHLQAPWSDPRPLADPLLPLGLGLVEGARGQVAWLVTPDETPGSLGHVRIASPSVPNLLAVSRATPGNILTDFPIIESSFGLAYAGISL